MLLQSLARAGLLLLVLDHETVGSLISSQSLGQAWFIAASCEQIVLRKLFICV